MIGIGCEVHTFDEWEMLADELAVREGVDAAIYRKYALIVKEWMEINMPVKVTPC
jgi:hypothetical protein